MVAFVCIPTLHQKTQTRLSFIYTLILKMYIWSLADAIDSATKLNSYMWAYSYLILDMIDLDYTLDIFQ